MKNKNDSIKADHVPKNEHSLSRMIDANEKFTVKHPLVSAPTLFPVISAIKSMIRRIKKR